MSTLGPGARQVRLADVLPRAPCVVGDDQPESRPEEDPLRCAGGEQHAHPGREGAVRARGGETRTASAAQAAHGWDVARGATPRYKGGMLPRLAAAALLCAAAPVRPNRA